ncbi:hypothetical protein PR048_002689 [Dryococelus australis]|uniref:Uncharacterized protein n=1 Tax=Dryococelus australis TaxID=614101 RepID=A0ABQ9IKV8_9NEOP|nr:hypothetical protein PR048_002689 [Dryococelus australis]
MQSKKEFVDDLPNDNVFAMTPKGYITKEEFCNFLQMQLFRSTALCSHELQPLDKSFFKPLKVKWNSAVDNF